MKHAITSTRAKDENIAELAEVLASLAQSFKNESENCAKMCGDVSEKDMVIILFVGKNKNVKMSEIADNIAAPMSTLTNIIDRLVEKKLLLRDHSGEDRRVINVSLAPAGKTAYTKLVDKRKKLVESILSNLNEREQALAIKYLKMLSEKIGVPQ